MVRLFWALMAVVFIGAGVIVFSEPSDSAPTLSAAPRALAQADPTPRVISPPLDQRTDRAAPVDRTPQETEPAPARPGPKMTGEVVRETPPTLPPTPQQTPTTQPDHQATEQAQDPAPAGEPGEREPIDKLAIDTDAGATLDDLLGLDAADEEADSAGDPAGAPPGSAEPSTPRETDGGAVLGERFEVSGAGTKAEPFVVGWDVLMSAQETYRPRQGKKDIPEWVQQINDKYVRVEGFIVLPVMGGTMNEVLLARNEWDGCCIGVPPTAYDSIEVRLRDDGRVGGRHAVNYGSIVGKLKVDPYLWKDWLISMYVMEDSVMEIEGL